MCPAGSSGVFRAAVRAARARSALPSESASAKRHLSVETRSQGNADYCVSLVKRCDYENYLCLLLLPSAVRHPAFVIRAANVEIASVMDSVSGLQTAAGRFAFWRECVDRACRQSPVVGHPVAEELALVIAKCKLSKMWFSKLISARERLLKEAHMQSVLDVESYAEDTCSAVNYLLLEAAGVRSLSADHAASHLGKCQGVVNLLRGAKHMASKGVTYFPQDLLLEHNISQEDVLRSRNSSGVREVVYELASLANGHLHKFFSESRELPKTARTACLSHVVCATALENFRRLDFDIADPKWNRKFSMLPWTLWRASRNI